MSIGMDKLFQMLSCYNDDITQEKGIEEGKKIKYISKLIKPIEDKNVWNNCAKIIVSKSDTVISHYSHLLLDWLQNENDPGFDIIYNKIKSMPTELIGESYVYTIHHARKQDNEKWLINLSRLIENQELYKYLSVEDRNIMNKYYDKLQLMKTKKENKEKNKIINQQKLEKENTRMQIGINELFKMLRWDSDEIEQKKAIEEGKKVKYMSIFIQPIEDKGIWENCAKIIASKSDEELKPYLTRLFQWLEDPNWPGSETIYNRLQTMPDEFIIDAFTYNMRRYIKLEDEMAIIWFVVFSKRVLYGGDYTSELQEDLSKGRKLYEKLTAQEIKSIRKNCDDYIAYEE